MLRRIALLAALVTACGSSASSAPRAGSGEISGSIAGDPVAVYDAVSGCGLLAASPVRIVDLFNIPHACSSIADAWPATERYLSLALFDSTASGIAAATAPGDFTVVPDEPAGAGKFAAVSFMGLPATVPQGQSGSVHVTAISAARITGSFDVMLTTGEPISGRFDAPFCDAAKDGHVSNGDLFPCP